MRPRRKYHLLSEINITPLTDVMLVLLVIFMATSSFVMTGQTLELNLPQAAGRARENSPQTLIIELNQAGKAALNGREMSLPALEERLENINQPLPPVILKIDRNCRYQNFISLLDFLSGRGFDRVSLAVENNPRELP